MPKQEAQTMEYKSSWQEDYFGWVAGYANAKGGTLYIGVNDDGYVVGVEDITSLLDKLPNQIASFLGITVSIDHGSVDGLGHNMKYGEAVPHDIASKPVNLYARGLLCQTVLSEIDAEPENVTEVSDSVQALFDAAPGFVKQLRKNEKYRAKIKADVNNWISEHPISQNPDGSLDYVMIKVNAFSHGVPYHGRYYIRSGGTNQELKGAELSQFLFDRVGLKWDSVPVSDVKLNHEALDFLREHALEKNRLTQKAIAVSDETLIKNLKGLTNHGEYTRAAAMLFGDPEDIVFGAYIRIGFFDKGRLKYQDEVHGPLISQAHRATDLIFAKYLKGLVAIKGLQRTETYMTTEEILREVILNAVAHKYYPSNLAIQIRVTDDHITVMNEGYWPFDRLPVEDVYEGEHASYSPNPLIGNGLFFAGAMDTWGQGFRLIKEECEKIEAPLPEIRASEKYVEVTIKASPKYMELLNPVDTTTSKAESPCSLGEHDGDQDEVQVKEQVGEQDKLIVFCGVARTRQEMMEHVGLTARRSFTDHYLKPLLQSGRLRMTLPDKPNSKNQKYIATKSEMERAQAIMDNNPVLALSPGDLKRAAKTVEEYLQGFSEKEQACYKDYYEDEL